MTSTDHGGGGGGSSWFHELQRQTPSLLRKNENLVFAWEICVVLFTGVATFFWMLDTFIPYFDRWILVVRGACASFLIVDLVKSVLLVILEKNYTNLLWNQLHQITAAISIVVTLVKIGTLDGKLPNLDFFYVLKLSFFWEVLRKVLSKKESISPIVFALIDSITRVLVLSFIFSGLFIVVENHYSGSSYNFFDGFYFVMVTFSTVGYGDRVALSDHGRSVTIAAILVGVAIIGSSLSQIVTNLADHRRFKQFQGSVSKHTEPHLVICGNITYEKLKTILSELYEGNRGMNTTTKVVILGKEPPTVEIEHYLSTSFLSSVVKFLVGNVQNPSDLERVALKTASGVFIVSGDDDSDAADAETIMSTIAISQFVSLEQKKKKKHSEPPSILCQLHNKKFEKFLAKERIRSICLGELKALVLAYNTFVPGFSTFISTLCLSCSINVSPGDPNWKKEFQEGIDQEIFSVIIDKNWLERGNTFAEVSLAIYKETGALSIALVEMDSEEENLILNPSSRYRVKPSDVFYVVGDDIRKLKGYVVQATSNKRDRRKPFNDKERRKAILSMRSQKTYRRLSDSEEEKAEGGDKTILGKLSFSVSATRAEKDNIDISKWEPFRVPPSVRNTPQYLDSYHQGLKRITRWNVNKSNHLVVAGDFSKLEFILKTTRDPDLPEVKHIVLLGPQPPATRFWRWEDDLNKVYYVRGDPSSIYEWRKCSVHKASNALILGKDRNDSQTILAFLACHQEKGPNTIITTDLANESSIQYIDGAFMNKEESFWMSKSFMAGKAFCDSVFDRALICGHYNSHLMDLLSLMITRETLETEKQSWLMSIDVPPSFVNKTILDYFCFSTLFGVVPVALYRNNPTGPRYCYTNPERNTFLTQYDKVMVLVPYILFKSETDFKQMIEGNLESGKKYCAQNGGKEEIIMDTKLYEEHLRKRTSSGSGRGTGTGSGTGSGGVRERLVELEGEDNEYMQLETDE